MPDIIRHKLRLLEKFLGVNTLAWKKKELELINKRIESIEKGTANDLLYAEGVSEYTDRTEELNELLARRKKLQEEVNAENKKNEEAAKEVCTMSELFDRRALFTRLLPRLIDKMIADGYTPLHGKDGLKHMKNSLHYEGLAVDIDLFKDGVYIDTTDGHRPFGEYWENLDPLCAWGGRFKDGNHYSVTYRGRK